MATRSRGDFLGAHPNVVTVYDSCITDDWFMLVMEYVPGGTLKDRLTQPLAPRVAARLVERIARAMQPIHALGLLHLDLKPPNILLDGEPNAPLDEMVPKVSDFGVARTRSANTTDTAGMIGGGTPSYMAPEQFNTERCKLTVAADIHGLGAILYHALTGRPPYQAATFGETVEQVRNLDAVPPRRLNPAIPRDLETFCLKMFGKGSQPKIRDGRSPRRRAKPLARRPANRDAPGLSRREKPGWCRRRPVVAALSRASFDRRG